MQTYRITTRLPTRTITKAPMAACYLARPTYHHPRHMSSFFPRFPTHDLAPLFRLFDDSAFESTFSRPSPRPTFQPRFDVREEADSFHLTGDLPGIDQKDLQIEFADQNTLVVRGRTVKEHTSGTPPAVATAVEGSDKGKQIADTSSHSEAERPSSASSNYHKATVEDEFVDVQSEHSASSATADNQTNSNNNQEVSKADAATTETPAPTAPTSSSSGRYWVSERSVGEFHRSFSFPGHVDQDGVKASLKNGVLDVVVPKAARKEPRRIVVE